MDERTKVVADLLERFSIPRYYAGDFFGDYASRILKALDEYDNRPQLPSITCTIKDRFICVTDNYWEKARQEQDEYNAGNDRLRGRVKIEYKDESIQEQKDGETVQDVSDDSNQWVRSRGLLHRRRNTSR